MAEHAYSGLSRFARSVSRIMPQHSIFARYTAPCMRYLLHLLHLPALASVKAGFMRRKNRLRETHPLRFPSPVVVTMLNDTIARSAAARGMTQIAVAFHQS